MKRFSQIISEALAEVNEVFPWDVEALLQDDTEILTLDIREPYEFDAMRIEGSLNVPRGILETACEYDYEETEPTLAEAREKTILVVCRSGNRSVLAAQTLQWMGYQSVYSLKTGLRGWNDAEMPLVSDKGECVALDVADDYFTPNLRADQLRPK